MNPDADPMDGQSRSREAVAVIDHVEPPSQPGSADVTSPANGPRIGRVVVISLLVIGAAFAFGLIPRLKQRAEVHADARELALPTVSTVTAAPAKAGPPLVLSGELRPQMEAPIYARANGYVRRWLVDIGTKVTQGQLLAELDTPELDREHAQARAELAQAEAARALAESTAKRWREMLAGKTVSSQEADEKFADVELKKATVEAASARAERLENLLGFAKVAAPFAGTVTGRQIDVGQLITGGGNNELFRLAQTDKLRVFVRVPQSYARSVAIGQTAELTVPEIPGRKFEGKILRTAGAGRRVTHAAFRDRSR
jgi:RND family efflux transporter MFP subunit